MRTDILQSKPLAERVRPSSFDQFFGQDDIIGKGSFLRQAIEKDQVPSLILWGPPGSGKTTLAHIIATLTKADFHQLSAVASGKKDLLEIIKRAEQNQRLNSKTILFIDEIHRWNKAQQDALLPHVEKGTIILIGATTENPSFEVIGALLSRSRVIVLKALATADIVKIINQTLGAVHAGFSDIVQVDNKTIELIARLSNGDARIALNILELAAGYDTKITINVVKKVVHKENLYYDKNGEEHYNIISALHKSLRGGDADAGLYWLARMLEGGEDPLYVARRLLRFASEDVGLANNNALLVANAAFEACQKIGMPECSVHLAQCVVYLARSKKSVVAYDAYEAAKCDVKEHGNLQVPLSIRNAPTKLMKELGYGKGYKYTPKEDSSDQEYFPEKLKGKKYLE